MSTGEQLTCPHVFQSKKLYSFLKYLLTPKNCPHVLLSKKNVLISKISPHAKKLSSCTPV